MFCFYNLPKGNQRLLGEEDICEVGSASSLQAKGSVHCGEWFNMKD